MMYRDGALKTYLGCDDGCGLYLDGVELVRNRVPDSKITRFSKSVMGDEEAFAVIRFPISSLRDGTNQVVVEGHQVNPSSSDLRLSTRLVIE